MLNVIKKLFKSFIDRHLNTDPYIDTVTKSIDGTPLTILITPKPFVGGPWRTETTPIGIQASVLKFGMQQDLGKYQEQIIDALEGRLNNFYTKEDLEQMAVLVDKAIENKGYRAFKHNGKGFLEFIPYSLDPRDITKLRQAVQQYRFNLL